MRQHHKRAIPALLAVIVVFSLAVAMPVAATSSATTTGTTLITQNGQAQTTSITQNNNGSHYTISNTSHITFTEAINASNINVSLGNSPASGSFATSTSGKMVNVTYNGASAATSATLDNITFTYNLSDNASKTGVIHTNNLTAPKNLSVDPNNHVQKYRVFDEATHATYNVTGTGNATFNATSGTFNVTKTGHVTIVMHVTRNNTDYTNYSFHAINRSLTFNTSLVGNPQDVTPATQNVSSPRVATNGDNKTFTWTLGSPNNTTKAYTIKVNGTLEGGAANSSIVSGEGHSPMSGPHDTHNVAYAASFGPGISGFHTNFNFGNVPWKIVGAIAIIVLLIGAAAIFLNKKQGSSLNLIEAYSVGTGMRAYAWFFVFLIIPLSMVADIIFPHFWGIFTFNFWTNLLTTTPVIKSVISSVGDAYLAEGVIAVLLVLAFWWATRMEAKRVNDTSSFPL